tara:strand:+ start:1171 stop:1548 length:378 start_codon:yes stop_codon:yes gene_type:complete
MNKVIFSIFFLTLSCLIYSQNYESKINENIKFKKLLELSKKSNTEIYKSNYFSIQVYSGSLKKADSILNMVEQKYLNDSIFLFFETPNYKVHIGKFKSKVEAQKKLRNVLGVFRSAFILKPNTKI